jgi:hypothetical protein
MVTENKFSKYKVCQQEMLRRKTKPGREARSVKGCSEILDKADRKGGPEKGS